MTHAYPKEPTVTMSVRLTKDERRILCAIAAKEGIRAGTLLKRMIAEQVAHLGKQANLF